MTLSSVPSKTRLFLDANISPPNLPNVPKMPNVPNQLPIFLVVLEMIELRIRTSSSLS